MHEFYRREGCEFSMTRRTINHSPYHRTIPNVIREINVVTINLVRTVHSAEDAFCRIVNTVHVDSHINSVHSIHKLSRISQISMLLAPGYLGSLFKLFNLLYIPTQTSLTSLWPRISFQLQFPYKDGTSFKPALLYITSCTHYLTN